MPLPWKMARVTRISRLVADLQTPKHGGSLVIETGFPTSLIDLFVKNRDRLKKPSLRRKKRLEISDPVILSSPPLDLRLNSSASDGFWGSAVSRIENLGCGNCEEKLHGIDAGGLVVAADHQVVVVEERAVGGSNASEVFWAILKMFIVVVLALGTKKLAVGITMSAFVLLLLECLGKRVVCLLKPCSAMQMALKSLIRRVLPCVWRKQGVRILDEDRGSKTQVRLDEMIDSKSCSLVEDFKSDDSIEEIEIIEPNMALVAPIEEIQTLKPDFDMVKCDKRWRYEEVDTKKRIVEEELDGDEVLEQRNRRTRRAKLKAKILKKLVPNKFSSKKGKNSMEKERESSIEVSSSYLGEYKLGRCEEQDQQEDGDGQEPEDEEDKSSKSPSKEEDIDDGISSSGELSKVFTGMAKISEEEGRETEGNSGYLILVLIVLAGLVGGRIVALFLIIAWCFTLKSVKTLRRFTIVPMIRSYV